MLHQGVVVAEGTADELTWQLEGERVELTFADATSYALAAADVGVLGTRRSPPPTCTCTT